MRVKLAGGGATEQVRCPGERCNARLFDVRAPTGPTGPPDETGPPGTLAAEITIRCPRCGRLITVLA